MSFLRDKALLPFCILLISLSTLSYHHFQGRDPSRCKVLLEDGFWLNPSQLSNWQPAGCMLHTYRPQETTACLKDRRAVFIGGTTTLDLFEAIVTKIDPSFTLPSLSRESNHVSTVSDVRFEFLWDPLLESQDLRDAGVSSGSTRPALTVIGFERDYVRHSTNLTDGVSHVRALVSDISQTPNSDATVLLPVLEIGMEQLSETNFITPAKIDLMNDVLAQLSFQHNTDVAFALNRVTRGPDALLDGLHPAPKAAAIMADILLNRVCNTKLPKHYPFASTCCNTYPGLSWVQSTGFIFIAMLLPVAFLLHRRGHTAESSRFLSMMPAPRYYLSILVVGTAVVLCYYFDRTNVFGKEQKQTSPIQFFVLMLVIIAGSLYTLKTADTDLPFLNRDQTDEWKGWMQIAILVYHYVGVSKTEYIYNYMRVMPTSYLFMTGFGHTVYFLKKEDFSFKRVVATMLRLNLLNVILAYAMGNDWLLYYFAPLVTWNFFVIWTLLFIGHKHNKNLAFLLSKMGVAAAINTAFYRIPGVLEIFWSILQLLFRMQGDLREWRFRITLDQYSVFPGMIAAVLFINFGSYALPKSPSWPLVVRVGCAVSAAIMLGYAYFEATQPSKQAYNQKHTYVSWLPCCAFVILRNATPWLRKTHNGFFAWAGRGSLETFLLQFHLWLAADTAGLLMVGPPHQRLLNCLLITPIFFYVASLVTTHTGSLIEWIMGAEPKPTRPALPTTFKSHVIVPGANGHAFTEKAAAYESVNGNGLLNGHTVEVKIQDPSTLERRVEELESANADLLRAVRRVMAAARKDLRVRVLLILAAMALMNWTYYL